MSAARVPGLGNWEYAFFISVVLRVLLLILFAIGLSSCSAKNSGSANAGSPTGSPTATPVAQDVPGQTAPAKKIFETSEAVPAGYLGYKVFGSYFKDEPGGKGTTLYIDLAIVNTDKKERPAGPMKLVDESGKEYSLSDTQPDKGVGLTKVGMVGSTQSKRAVAVFEAPRNHEYQLKIQGFSPADEVKIKLKPESNPPAK